MAWMTKQRPDYWRRAQITHPMADSRRPEWERVFGPHRNVIKKVLEVGSYEGQSMLFWHNYFKAAVTCVDKWEDIAPGCPTSAEVERHFDANASGLPITKLKMPSTDALLRLQREGASFDLIYIDGDHSRLQVMIDSSLAWPLLRVGGFMVWDDYRTYRTDLIDRPAPAVDAFVAAMGEEITVINDTGQQLMVQKLDGASDVS